MNMVRLIYVSRFSKGVGPNDLQAILSISRNNNLEKGITGMLCYDPHYFLQCLEGPRHAINQLYGKIIADPRHEEVTLLEYSDIHQRVFENWSMAYIRSDILTEHIMLKYSPTSTFDPFIMTAQQALGFITHIAAERDQFLKGDE